MADKTFMNYREDEFYRFASHNNINVLERLINQYNVNVNARSTINGDYPLFIAVKLEYVDVVKLILDQPNVDVSISTRYNGYNALHYAVSNNRYNREIITMLLNKGVDINEQANNDETPLALAAYYGNLDAVKLLLEYGADLTIADINGNTPEDIAMNNIVEENDNYQQIADYIGGYVQMDIKEPGDDYDTDY